MDVVTSYFLYFYRNYFYYYSWNSRFICIHFYCIYLRCSFRPWPSVKRFVKKKICANLKIGHNWGLLVSQVSFFFCLGMAYQLRPALYRKVCFYSTSWSRGKEGQNRLLRAKLNLCWAAACHEIKPVTLSAVFIIRWPFLCVLCCDFDVLGHNRGATILWRSCQ